MANETAWEAVQANADSVIAVGTVALVVATGVLAWATFQLAASSRTLENLTREAHERNQAEFQIHGGVNQWSLPAGGTWAGIVFDIVNSGWHDSAIASASLEIEGRLGAHPLEDLLRTTSEGWTNPAMAHQFGVLLSQDLMVRSGDRIRIQASLNATEEFAGRQVRLLVQPVLGDLATTLWFEMPARAPPPP